MTSKIRVGSRVGVEGKPHLGKANVRFMGPVKFSSKTDWVGLELTTPAGNHNGTVKGVSYFNCPENHGIFVRLENLLPTKPEVPKLEKKRDSLAPKPSSTRKDASPTPSTSSSASSGSGRTAKEPAKEPQPAAPKDTPPKEAKKEVVAKAQTPVSSEKPAVQKQPSPAQEKETPAAPPKETKTKDKTPDETLISQKTATIALDTSGGKGSKIFTAAIKELSDWKQNAVLELAELQGRLDSAEETKKKLTYDFELLKLELDKKGKIGDKELLRAEEKFKSELAKIKDDLEEQIGMLSDDLESQTLDKEIAEQKAEQLEKELETLKQKIEIEKTRLAGSGTGASDSDADSAVDSEKLQELKQQNARLTEALLKLKDVAIIEKQKAERQGKELERIVEITMPKLEAKIEKLSAEIDAKEDLIETLKDELDVALESESVVSELSFKNLDLERTVKELTANIEDLEDLRDVSQELEENQAEMQKKLKGQVHRLEVQLLDLAGTVKNLKTEAAEKDRAIAGLRTKIQEFQRRVVELTRLKGEVEEVYGLKRKEGERLEEMNMKLRTKMKEIGRDKLDLAVRCGNEKVVANVVQFLSAVLPVGATQFAEIDYNDLEAMALVVWLQRVQGKARIILDEMKRTYGLETITWNLIHGVQLLAPLDTSSTTPTPPAAANTTEQTTLDPTTTDTTPPLVTPPNEQPAAVIPPQDEDSDKQQIVGGADGLEFLWRVYWSVEDLAEKVSRLQAALRTLTVSEWLHIGERMQIGKTFLLSVGLGEPSARESEWEVGERVTLDRVLELLKTEELRKDAFDVTTIAQFTSRIAKIGEWPKSAPNVQQASSLFSENTPTSSESSQQPVSQDSTAKVSEGEQDETTDNDTDNNEQTNTNTNTPSNETEPAEGDEQEELVVEENEEDKNLEGPNVFNWVETQQMAGWRTLKHSLTQQQFVQNVVIIKTLALFPAASDVSSSAQAAPAKLQQVQEVIEQVLQFKKVLKRSESTLQNIPEHYCRQLVKQMGQSLTAADGVVSFLELFAAEFDRVRNLPDHFAKPVDEIKRVLLSEEAGSYNNDQWQEKVVSELSKIAGIIRDVVLKLQNSNELSSPVKKVADAEQASPWDARAAEVKHNLLHAGSVRGRLELSERENAEKARTVAKLEAEVKEFLRKVRILEISIANFQQKEEELRAENAKAVQAFAVKEKMYLEAVDALQKDNDRLTSKVHSLNEDRKRMEDAHAQALANQHAAGAGAAGTGHGFVNTAEMDAERERWQREIRYWRDKAKRRPPHQLAPLLKTTSSSSSSSTDSALQRKFAVDETIREFRLWKAGATVVDVGSVAEEGGKLAPGGARDQWRKKLGERNEMFAKVSDLFQRERLAHGPGTKTADFRSFLAQATHTQPRSKDDLSSISQLLAKVTLPDSSTTLKQSEAGNNDLSTLLGWLKAPTGTQNTALPASRRIAVTGKKELERIFDKVIC